MAEALTSFFSNPIVLGLIFFLICQALIIMGIFYFSKRKDKLAIRQMETVLNESETRVQNILNQMSKNRQDLLQSIESMATLLNEGPPPPSPTPPPIVNLKNTPQDIKKNMDE